MNSDAGEEGMVETGTDGGRRAMEGLRTIWQATGQMQEEFVRLECTSEGEGCSASLGFDYLAEGMEPAGDSTDDSITRLRSAWKTTLAREGKLHDPDTSAPDPVGPGQEEGRGRPE